LSLGSADSFSPSVRRAIADENCKEARLTIRDSYWKLYTWVAKSMAYGVRWSKILQQMDHSLDDTSGLVQTICTTSGLNHLILAHQVFSFRNEGFQFSSEVA